MILKTQQKINLQFTFLSENKYSITNLTQNSSEIRGRRKKIYISILI